MLCRGLVLASLVLFWLPALAQAGLYYSGEALAELPSQWRGFLLDQRSLRTLAVSAQATSSPNPLREQYRKKAAELEKTKADRPLTAAELADLGAIYVRTGEVGKAVELLRAAQRQYPQHFHLAANLGTAWQLHGDLQQAALALQQAVKLAPEKQRRAEEYHLKLVKARLREPKGSQELDDLFGVRFGTAKNGYEPGQLAAKEKQKLPKDAVALVQQLCLWLPADARLLWQLAEIANAFGDVRMAANMMDGCVTQFGLQSRELRQHRQILRTAADKLAQGSSAARKEHEGHVGGLAARSKRPLLTKLDISSLPPIDAAGLNRLPWVVLAETHVDSKFRPTFADYLQKLNGKKITLNGFMQPFNEELEQTAFMFIEYPIGCWYCEMPEITSILLVETPRGKSTGYTRGLVRVTGQLQLNYTDPEEFLYTIRNATVSEVD